MQLFGNLKNIPKEQMEVEIAMLLEEVQLNHVSPGRVLNDVKRVGACAHVCHQCTSHNCVAECHVHTW